MHDSMSSAASSTTLADEIEPFAGDVRRACTAASAGAASSAVVASRRWSSSSLAVSTVAVARGAAARTRSTSPAVPSKEVSPDQITHIDAIVVPATPAVKDALGRVAAR